MKSGNDNPDNSPERDPPTSASTLRTTSEPVDQVLLWLLEGNRTPDIVDAIKERFPRRDANKLIKKALSQLADVAYADTDIIKGWCFEAYREMYRRMVDVGDYKGAIVVIKELRKECC